MAKAQASTAKSTASKAATKSAASKAKASVGKKEKNAPFAQAVGRRKSAVARVWLRKGKGEIVVNGRPFDEYFDVPTASAAGQASFNAFSSLTKGMTADINIKGGGFTAQADAVKLGIARALVSFDETLKVECRKLGFLTVDSRLKERKKPGQKAARAKFQFTKR
ncbi:MAG: 30S ribosomal protein S9 [Epsilonproteobacteria bacterium]|nr:30S ribosomal protein S9 [Campylobacterota bacterium]|tara:strand:+ start:4281 stop:4775 length:495 start_codon:yes stop_codon:yes gene_type:complete